MQTRSLSTHMMQRLSSPHRTGRRPFRLSDAHKQSHVTKVTHTLMRFLSNQFRLSNGHQPARRSRHRPSTRSRLGSTTAAAPPS